MRSNCLIFAVLLYQRRRKKGKVGYIVFRGSRLTRLFHAMYGELRRDGRLRVVNYIPNDARRKTVPPVLFKGNSKWGDL